MNRLSDQTSPYLLQHADNPVDWHPWDAQALDLARSENKPILLSIGYSACHWCHVMAHESFESNQVAALMNKHFVNIKVDREERPDLDRIYQTAHQILTRQGGGWPLTIFLDPTDHLPIYSGTYFPPQPRSGMPGFREVLRGIADAWSKQNERMQEFKGQLREALGQVLGGGGAGDLDETLIERACGQIDASFDAARGGFSEAPKFPHPAGLELLHDVAAASDAAEKSERALHMLDLTLAAMARGGVFDHLGGGFFRYSVDAEWSIPHFEKMLYDNGLLLSLYARRARETANTGLAWVATQTAQWMLREMQLADGGICSSLDADSDGGEGRYYVWYRDEVSAALGADYDAFAAHYGLDGKANFEKCWHLRLAPPQADAPLAALDPPDECAAARDTLLALREERVRPARDDKILSAWNALAIRGLADAGRELAQPEWLEAATRAVDFLYAAHWRDGRLFATSRNGTAHLNAYLDDHAFLIEALLELLAARWRDADLAFATALADTLLAHFEDRDGGGFFFTADDHETLIQRTRSFGDDALPSGNGVAARALLELGHLVGEPRYLEAAERTLRAAMTDVERWPSAHGTLLRALLDFNAPPARVVLRCAEPADAGPWVQAATAALDARARCYVIPADASLPAALAERRVRDGAGVTAYLCKGHTCSAPATSLDGFAQVLDG